MENFTVITNVRKIKEGFRMPRGSLKHVLDWTECPKFVLELTGILSSIPIKVTKDSKWMPCGYREPSEARLETFGPAWMPAHPAWPKLTDWWLRNKKGANTPNWDIALGCEIENRPGLVLVEAKANWPELKTEEKRLSANASNKSRENHDQIGRAINEARLGWQRVDPDVAISRDTHYQLSNRLAFTWKLGMLGFPVVLLYIGFTGDEGIRDVGNPFANEQDWEKAFFYHANKIVPRGLFDQRIDLGPAPVWLVSRSKAVIEVST